jgi:hypothetical protein
MSNPNYLEVVTKIGSLLSGIGLFATAAGLVFLARQTRASERATTAAVYQSIVAMGNSINDMLIEKPELYGQLFGVNSFSSDTTVDELQSRYPQRFFAAQKWLDYFEIILVMWPAIPDRLHDPWRDYIKSYLGSSALLQFLVFNSRWYGHDLKQLCREGIRAQQLSEKKVLV